MGRSPPGLRMPLGAPSLAGAPAAGQPCRPPPGRRTADAADGQQKAGQPAYRRELAYASAPAHDSLVGHTDPIGPEPSNIALGQRRAMEAQTVLLDAIERLRPGLSRQINIVPQNLGESRPAARDRMPEARASHRRVEIFLSIMAAAPTPLAPMPSPVQPPPPAPSRPGRLPTPEEAARAVVPLGPETPEERIGRSLTPPPPTPPPRRAFSEMFWRRMDARLHSTMSRVGVPPSLRGPIRDAAHAAIRQGGEGLVNRALDETGLSSEAKEAMHATVRAAAQTPIR
jgi:hypothetical protein